MPPVASRVARTRRARSFAAPELARELDAGFIAADGTWVATLVGIAADSHGPLCASSPAAGVAWYGHFIDGFIYDSRDEGMAAEDGLALLCTDTMMHDAANRERLAREVLAFASELME